MLAANALTLSTLDKDSSGPKKEYFWVTKNGYVITECKGEKNTIYRITAPDDKYPFAYTPVRSEVAKIIQLDMESRSGR